MSSRFVLPYADVGSGIRPSCNANLYFYDTGTTTLRNTYSDEALTIANTNPVVANQEGVFTNIWLDGRYKVILKNKDDVQLWEADPVGDAPLNVHIRISDVATLKTTNLVVGDTVVTTSYYGDWETLDKNPSGGGNYNIITLVEYTQITNLSAANEFGDFLLNNGLVALLQRTRGENVIDQWGARSNNLTDATANIQASIDDFISRDGSGLVIFPSGDYRINGTVYWGSDISIDFHNSTMEGTGIGGNNMFETGYISGNGYVSNILTGSELNRVTRSNIRGGRLRNCGRGFNMKNFNEDCVISEMSFSDVTQALYASRCFYATFRDIINRGTAGNSPLACFFVERFNNVITFQSVFCVDRVLAFEFLGPHSALEINNCGAEACTVGMLFTDGGDVGPVTINNGYFEGISDKAIHFPGDQNTQNVTIRNSWFHNTVNAVVARGLIDSSFYGNKESGSNSNIVDVNDANTSLDITMPNVIVPANTLPTNDNRFLTHSYSLTHRIANLRDTGGSGQVEFKTFDYNGSKVPLTYYGDSGSADVNTIPFCVTTKVDELTGGNYHWLINTNIVWRPDTMILMYKLRTNDNSGNQQTAGIIYGDQVPTPQINVGSLVVTIVDNSGFAQIKLDGLFHPSLAGSIFGIVRLV